LVQASPARYRWLLGAEVYTRTVAVNVTARAGADAGRELKPDGALERLQ